MKFRFACPTPGEDIVREVDVTFALDGEKFDPASMKTMATILLAETDKERPAAAYVSDYEKWCEQPDHEKPKAKYHLSYAAIVNAITDILRFDGKRLTAAEFWELVNGECFYVMEFAHYIIRVFCKNSLEQKEQQP